MRVKTLCILIIGFLAFSMRAERTDVSNKVLNTGDWEVGFTFTFNPIVGGESNEGFAICGYNGNSSSVRIPAGFDVETCYRIDRSGPYYVETNFWYASLSSGIFSGNTNIKSVDFGSHTIIPSGCFENCSSLTKISCDSSFTEIGKSAFENCTSLTSVEMLTLSKLGNFAFKGCTGLYNCSIGGDAQIPPGIFEGCSSLEKLNLLGNMSFSGWTIPGNFRDDFRPPFTGCSKLSEVVLGKGFTKIPGVTFENLHSLTNVSVTEYLERIESKAFNGCSSLRHFVSAVRFIGSSAFNGCSSLESVTLGPADIGESAFSECYSLKSVNIRGPGNCVIRENAFANLTLLESLEGANYIVNIGDNAFNGCSSLVGPLELNHAEIIGVSAFNGCGLLSGDLILQRLECLGDNAFNSCSSLTSVVTHQLKNMGASAFEGCISLRECVIDGESTIGNKVFAGCTSLEKIKLLGKTKFVESYYKQYFFSYDNSPFNGCGNLFEVELDKGIEKIPNITFSYLPSLRSVKATTSLKRIDSEAFLGCSSLEVFNGFSSVTNIGESAFSGCSSLTGKVELAKVQALGKGVFKDCERIRQVKFGKDLEVVRADAFSGSTNLIAFTFEGLPPEADDNAFRNVKKGALGIYPTSTLKFDDTEEILRSVQTLSETPEKKKWCDVIADDGTWEKLLMAANKPILTNDVYDVEKGYLQLNWENKKVPMPNAKEYGITYEIRRGFSDNYETADILTNGYDRLQYVDKQFDFTGGVSRIWYWVKPEHECTNLFERSDSCRTKNRYGVSVGFSRYSKPSENGITYFDAYELYNVANKNSGFEMKLLSDEKAKCGGFISTIDEFSEKTTPGDIVLCFIATHGKMGDENEEPSLLFYDFLFPYSKLSLQCSKIIDKQARFVGIIMSCHAEAMVNGGKIPADDEVLNNLQECGLRQCGAYSAYSAWVTSCRMTEYSHGKNGDLLTRFTRAFCVNGWDKGYADKNLYLLGEIITVGTHNDNRLNLLEIAEYSKEMYIGGNSGEPFKKSSSVGIHNPDLLSRIDVGSSWTADDLGGISAPINVRACKRKGDKGDECVIEWDSVMNADEYRVYRQFYGADPVLVGIVNRPLCQDKIISWFRSSKVDIRYFIQAVHERGISKKSNMTEGFSIDEELCLWSENYVRNYFSENGLMLATDFSENDWMKLIDSDLDGDGVSVCDEIVAGVSPIDNTSKFTANITMENGKPKVTPNPDLGDKRKYTIYGKKDLSSQSVDWSDMSTVPELEKSEYRFFKVDVSLP